MKLNLNLKLTPAGIKHFFTMYWGALYVLAATIVVAYTIFFITNLFYGTSELDTQAKQQESSQSKQIKFNQKTIESLRGLVPTSRQPDTTNVGRSNPFAPN